MGALLWLPACSSFLLVDQVVKQGPGQYYCEYDGTTLPTMVRRYIFAAKVRTCWQDRN